MEAPKLDTMTTLSAKAELKRYDDVRSLIATPDNPTPLVRVNRAVSLPGFELYLKLEWMNPFG